MGRIFSFGLNQPNFILNQSGYLTGDPKMPNPKDSTFSKWDIENAMVGHVLAHSLYEA